MDFLLFYFPGGQEVAIASIRSNFRLEVFDMRLINLYSG